MITTTAAQTLMVVRALRRADHRRVVPEIQRQEQCAFCKEEIQGDAHNGLCRRCSEKHYE